jgi:hypothetical protein
MVGIFNDLYYKVVKKKIIPIIKNGPQQESPLWFSEKAFLKREGPS